MSHQEEPGPGSGSGFGIASGDPAPLPLGRPTSRQRRYTVTGTMSPPAFTEVCVVGEVQASVRRSYRISVIEPVHGDRLRRFIEIRMVDKDQPTSWHLRLVPTAIPELLPLLERAASMARGLP